MAECGWCHTNWMDLNIELALLLIKFSNSTLCSSLFKHIGHTNVKGLATPLPKAKVSNTNPTPSNFRPISLLSITSKLLEKKSFISGSRSTWSYLIQWLQTNGISYQEGLPHTLSYLQFMTGWMKWKKVMKSLLYFCFSQATHN